MQAAQEKLLAVPRPIAGGRDGLHVMQLDGDSVQDISWPGLQAPVEAYIGKAIEYGAIV